MNAYVIDTSVTLGWYLEERFSEAARAWQDRLLGGKVRLITPSLHCWEYANAFHTLVTLAFEYGATAYDAVFIALALARELPLVTAERTTTRWVTKLGRRVEPVR